MKKETCKNNLKDRRLLLMMLAVSLGFSLAFVGGFFFSRFSFAKTDVSGAQIDPSSVQYHLDASEPVRKLGDLYLPVSGWALRRGMDIRTVECHVVLRDTKTGTYYQLKTYSQVRKEVTQQFNDTHDYDNSGFYALVKNSLLERNTVYQVCVLYRNNNDNALIHTDAVIRKQP